MRNQPSQIIILIENHPIRTRRTTRVRLPGAQNREFIICWWDGEVNVLVVVVLVRVVATADGLASLVVVETGFFGGVGGASGVALAAAGVVTGAGFEVRLRKRQRALDEEEGGEGKELGEMYQRVLSGWLVVGEHTLVNCILD